MSRVVRGGVEKVVVLALGGEGRCLDHGKEDTRVREEDVRGCRYYWQGYATTLLKVCPGYYQQIYPRHSEGEGI